MEICKVYRHSVKYNFGDKKWIYTSAQILLSQINDREANTFISVLNLFRKLKLNLLYKYGVVLCLFVGTLHIKNRLILPESYSETRHLKSTLPDKIRQCAYIRKFYVNMYTLNWYYD